MKLTHYLDSLVRSELLKMTLSKPKDKSFAYKKTVIERKKKGFQASQYTDKQVFHLNFEKDVTDVLRRLADNYLNVNAVCADGEYVILINKKGNCVMKKTSCNVNCATDTDHNRKKNYILSPDEDIKPLRDMGIVTKDNKVASDMYDKFRQINRFIEIVDDCVKSFPKDTIRVVDFGCGKSYLTFLLYHYLTNIRKLKAEITGLDLKEDVIRHCNDVAKKYGYDGLHFEVGDINGYKCDKTDMVVTLHACDTATDYALYNAVRWKAKYIFSVPCCQHELNAQMDAKELRILQRYGIVAERFSALATDAIRANVLQYCGYKTQLMEFIDITHTPKNLLIRAELRAEEMSENLKNKYKEEVDALLKEFSFRPTICKLLTDND